MVEVQCAPGLQMWASEPVPCRRQASPACFSLQLAHSQREGGRQVAARQVINQRRHQEDFYCVDDLSPDYSLVAVFDGHGGAGVARYCATQLPQLLKRRLSSVATTQAAQHASWCPAAAAAAAAGPVACSCPSMEQVQQALVHAFADCDASLPHPDALEGGSTAVCVLLGPNHIWAANCGDSRAVIARRGQPAVPLTDDHKPERPDEEARIREAGGLVFWNGGHRVMGVLSMSRAMGDLTLKQYGVISTPEVVCMPRTPDDQFVLLASDGLWASLSSEDAVGLAQECIARAEARGADRQAALRVATQVLIKAAVQQGSTDNITVILCDLQGAAPATATATAAGGPTATASTAGVTPSQGHIPTHELPQRSSDMSAELPRLGSSSDSENTSSNSQHHQLKHATTQGAADTAGYNAAPAVVPAAAPASPEPMDSSDSDSASAASSNPAGRQLARSITSPTQHRARQPGLQPAQLLHLLQLRSLSERARSSSHPGHTVTTGDASTAAAPSTELGGAAVAARRSLYGPPSGKRSTSEPPGAGPAEVQQECPSPTKRTRREASRMLPPPPPLVVPSAPGSPSLPATCSPTLPVDGGVVSTPTGLSMRVLCLPHHSSSSSSLTTQHSGSLLHRSTERLLLALDSPVGSPRHLKQ